MTSLMGCVSTRQGPPTPAARFASWRAAVKALHDEVSTPAKVNVQTLYRMRYGPRADGLRPSFLLLPMERRLARLSMNLPSPSRSMTASAIEESLSLLRDCYRRLAHLRSELVFMHLKREGPTMRGFCAPKSERIASTPASECPVPELKQLCAPPMIHAYAELEQRASLSQRDELRAVYDDALRRRADDIARLRDACYERSLRRQRSQRDVYKGDDRATLMEQAKRVWKRAFKDEPLVSVVITDAQWHRAVFSRVEDGRRRLYDRSTLNGFTYRSVRKGVVRGERIRWRVDHLSQKRWVELCMRDPRVPSACEPHDLYQGNAGR